MARPVTTFRVRSICVFFFNCSTSICRIKYICSRVRPGFEMSILVATRAPDSCGVLSAMSEMNGACKVASHIRNTSSCVSLIYWSGGGYSLLWVAHPYVVRSALSTTRGATQYCANEFTKQNGVSSKLAPTAVIWFLLGTVELVLGCGMRVNSAIFREIWDKGPIYFWQQWTHFLLFTCL